VEVRRRAAPALDASKEQSPAPGQARLWPLSLAERLQCCNLRVDIANTRLNLHHHTEVRADLQTCSSPLHWTFDTESLAAAPAPLLPLQQRRSCQAWRPVQHRHSQRINPVRPAVPPCAQEEEAAVLCQCGLKANDSRWIY